jgi:hypothetical protein
MFKETFGVELKDKTLVCQKPYSKSFDAIPYPHNFKVFMVWEHVSHFNAQMGIHGSLDHPKIRIFPLSLSGLLSHGFQHYLLIVYIHDINYSVNFMSIFTMVIMN